jgi:hypothetical protein
MQIYIIKYEKNNEEYKKVVLKITNEFTNETHWYSGFLNEVKNQKTWGKSGWLEQTATIRKDEENQKK